MTERKAGVYKTVHASNLEHETRAGWEFVAQVTEDDKVHLLEPDPAQPRTHDPYQSSPRFQPNGMILPDGMAFREAVVRKTTYLLRLSEESALAEWSKLHEVMEARERNVRAALEEVVAERGPMQQQLAKITEEHESLNRRYTRLNEEQSEAIEQKRKMERDLGKLREALGTQRVREILGA